MPEPTRPTRAEIDLSAIAANVRAACGLAGPGSAVMAVVKADAYGHGAIPVARVALAAGATWLGVAIPEEAAALRAGGHRRRASWSSAPSHPNRRHSSRVTTWTSACPIPCRPRP